MACPPLTRLESILGIMPKVYQVSEKGKKERKRYMGMCRWLSSLMIMIIKTLLVRVKRYRERNNAKSRSCSSPKLEEPRNTKPLQKFALVCSILSDIPDRFDSFCLARRCIVSLEGKMRWILISLYLL